jgi:hypothetical protein
VETYVFAEEVAMYSIGVDLHKAYSHMTTLDEQRRALRSGKVPNAAEAVHTFVAPYRDGGAASSRQRGTGRSCTTCWRPSLQLCTWLIC